MYINIIYMYIYILYIYVIILLHYSFEGKDGKIPILSAQTII